MVGFLPTEWLNSSVKIFLENLPGAQQGKCIPPEAYSSRRGFDMPAVVDKRPLQVEHVKTGAYS